MVIVVKSVQPYLSTLPHRKTTSGRPRACQRHRIGILELIARTKWQTSDEGGAMLGKVSVLITAAAILACGSARAQDAGSASGAGPGVVAVGMGDDGTLYGLPGVDVKLSLGAKEAFIGKFD